MIIGKPKKTIGASIRSIILILSLYPDPLPLILILSLSS